MGQTSLFPWQLKRKGLYINNVQNSDILTFIALIQICILTGARWNRKPYLLQTVYLRKKGMNHDALMRAQCSREKQNCLHLGLMRNAFFVSLICLDLDYF
jgi:hypothetical protein